jgi:hypothetical protein
VYVQGGAVLVELIARGVAPFDDINLFVLRLRTLRNVCVFLLSDCSLDLHHTYMARKIHIVVSSRYKGILKYASMKKQNT